MTYALREAVPDDSEAVAALHVACWGETYRGLLPDKMIDSMNLPDRTVQWQRALERRADVKVILAEDDAGLVGFASGGPARGADLGATREIYAIYVLRRAQRAGVGRALLHRLASHLALQFGAVPPGHDSVGLWVLRDNAPARAFYERMGGKPAGERIERRDNGDLPEVAYRWSDLGELMGPSPLDAPPSRFA